MTKEYMSLDFYFQHCFSSCHFIKYRFSLNQEFYFLLGSTFFAVKYDQVGQVRGAGLCPTRSEPLWTCLRVEVPFPGPSKVLICPFRREYRHKGKERTRCTSPVPAVYPVAPCQALLWFPVPGALTGSEPQSSSPALAVEFPCSGNSRAPSRLQH